MCATTHVPFRFSEPTFHRSGNSADKTGPSAGSRPRAIPQPVLINRYQQRYFLSRDGRVRLTVDCNQRVFDQRLSSKPNLARSANLPDTLVVEIKFHRADRQLANRYAQFIPLRLCRNSKYVIGVDSIMYD